MVSRFSGRTLQRLIGFALASTLMMPIVSWSEAYAIGPISPMPPVRPSTIRATAKPAKRTVRSKPARPHAARKHHKRVTTKRKKAAPVVVKRPQDLIGQMSTRTIAPGVVHKMHRGSLYINIIDVDLKTAQVDIGPVLASETFNRLDEVKDIAAKAQAIAAVNANYFKKDGTPLGTLVVDGEWVAGPLYDRTSFGITRDGQVYVEPVNLHGELTTSNPEAAKLWVNNLNQPRRTGSKLIAYTRRWGSVMKMQYAGALVAVDATGTVVAKAEQELPIPAGGFVLSDSKSSEISRLQLGDQVKLNWVTRPERWRNVVNAVSGGPILIRNGKLFVNLKDENFKASWTGSQIHARTAMGVTGDKHLLLATVEGPHTLWDLAKMLHQMGAVDALNLDGGGSTTMVVDGATVTRNRSTFQRRVASSLAIVPQGTRTARKPMLTLPDTVSKDATTPSLSPAALGTGTSQPDEARSSEPDATAYTMQSPYQSQPSPIRQGTNQLPAIADPVANEKEAESEPKKSSAVGKAGKALKWMFKIIP